MWLINVDTFELEKFGNSHIKPRYAILSHGWDTEEIIMFDDAPTMAASLRKYSRKYKYQPRRQYQPINGFSFVQYTKITEACRLVRKRHIRYAWGDSCCINKKDKDELAESINSMFRWYQQASVCIAFLSDWSEDLYAIGRNPSQWFYRGWTLQELLAPHRVTFYGAGVISWTRIGRKHELADEISWITGIDTEALRGTRPMHDYSVAQRMAWASKR